MEKGFSLAEALIAMLLLSVSVLGMLKYYQAMSGGFIRQWQFRQAWSEAHSQLEALSVSGKGYEIKLPGWQSQSNALVLAEGCSKTVVRIQTPSGYSAESWRWLCPP